MNYLKIITELNAEGLEKAVNEFFLFLNENQLKVQNTKYHIDHERAIAFIQYRV